MRGNALLVTEGATDAVTRIASRYLGREAGVAYAESGGDDLIIRLEPGDLRAWDFADEFSWDAGAAAGQRTAPCGNGPGNPRWGRASPGPVCPPVATGGMR